MEQTPLSNILGAKVRQARTLQSLTQADVAERIGLATEVYGRMERGKMLPSIRTLLKLCTELRVSSDELLGLANLDRPVHVVDGAPQARPSREVRRLLRRLEGLEANKLRLIGQVATALKR